MRVLGFELKKLLSMPALWGFIVLVLAVNIIMAVSDSYNEQIYYINAVTKITGTKYGEQYAEVFNRIVPPSDGFNEWYYESLKESMESAEDIFDSYSVKDAYDGAAKTRDQFEKPISKTAEQLLRLKFILLRPVVREKAASDEALSVYFGNMTAQIHESVFSRFGMFVLCETCLIAFLTVLFSLGYENMTKAEGLVYSTKTGRRLLKKKVSACLLAYMFLFLLVFGISYAVLFLINDFSGVWGQFVSSANNRAYYGDGSQPFLTWESLTIGQYFFKTAFVSFLVGIVFLLIGAVLGALMKNTYSAFGVLAFAVFLNVTAIFSNLPPLSSIFYFLLRMTPYGLIDTKSIWLTDGGIYGIIPHFETVFSVFYILFFAVLFLLSARRFRRKDVR